MTLRLKGLRMPSTQWSEGDGLGQAPRDGFNGGLEGDSADIQTEPIGPVGE